MRLSITCFLLWIVLFSFEACSQDNRNLTAFKNTEAYELAQAVDNEKIVKIDQLVNENPKLLDAVSKSGANVLIFSLYREKFKSFKRLLELGSNPNFINPYTKYSVLIEACKPFDNSLEWVKDNRFAKLLLKQGANPNYAVEKDFNNEQGIHINATSPLLRSSALNLELVRILVRYGADYKGRVGGKTPFAEAVSARKFEIINYYIDTLKIDVKIPLRIRTGGNLFIQDYIKRYMAYREGTEGDNLKQKLIKRLESKGVDFKNYEYKL